MNAWTVRKRNPGGMSLATVHLLIQVGLSARAALPLRNSGMSAGSVHRRRQGAESTRSIVSPGGRLRPVLSMRTGRRGSYPAHVG